MFECEITVKGGPNSPSKDGQPVTGPVESFFRNYSKCYSAVRKHVVKCPDCCPNEALRRFLLTREGPKLGGFTSVGLLDMALQMERACKKVPGKEVDRALVNEYVIRAAHPQSLIENVGRLTDAELLRALRTIWDQWEFYERTLRTKVGAAVLKVPSRQLAAQLPPLKEGCGRRGRLAWWMIRTICATWDASGAYPPEEELERLATVASVMLS